MSSDIQKKKLILKRLVEKIFMKRDPVSFNCRSQTDSDHFKLVLSVTEI